MGWRKRPLSIDTWVDIEVTDANDKPSLKATLDASVDESSETTFVALTVVDELKVTEKDVETKWNTIDFKFSSGSSDDFSLVSSGTGSSKKWALNTKKAFDYETTKSVKVKVYAQDNDGAAQYTLVIKIEDDDKDAPLSDTFTVTVNVDDVDEAPYIEARDSDDNGETFECLDSKGL